MSAAAALAACPRASIWQPSCKRRDCPFCGPRWARDVVHVMRVNLAGYGGPVVMVSVTPPGEDALPWDEAHCGHRKPHRHSGPRGCRVDQRKAREWNETAIDRMNDLRRAAAAHVRRTVGEAPNLLDRVWEPQKRGVAHWHGVFGVKTFRERRAVQEFVAYLKSEVEVGERTMTRAAFYGFGHVDGHLKPLSAEEAARYLASYLTGRNKHKATMRDAMVSPAMVALTGATVRKKSWPIFWLSPRLTRRTFVTMRLLRRARHAWAWIDGRCDPPRWTSATEAVKTAVVWQRCYRRRAGPEIDTDEALRLAAALEEAGNTQQFIDNGLRIVRVPVRLCSGWREQLDDLVRTIVTIEAPMQPALAVAA